MNKQFLEMRYRENRKNTQIKDLSLKAFSWIRQPTCVIIKLETRGTCKNKTLNFSGIFEV